MKTLLERIADMAPCVGGNVEEVLLDAAKEIEALRAKIEHMEKQKPVGHVYRHGNDSHGGQWHGVHWYDPNVDVPTGTKLYTLPGAQPAPSVLDPKTIRDLLDESGLCAYDREGDLAFMVAVTKFAALLAAPKPESE